MKKDTILFEQALQIAFEKVKLYDSISKTITLVRDLRGRIRILLPESRKNYQDSVIQNLGEDLSQSLGPYGYKPEDMVLYAKDLSLEESELRDGLVMYRDDRKTINLLDRQVVGQDWLKEPYARKTTIPRATFFGIKGGVGRSTALVIWAWYLAKQGKKVVVFDLDLESPGLSSTLLPPEAMPDFGIVDWFVEDGVGQGDRILDEMILATPIAAGLSGEIKVVPAFGQKTKEYLPKLSRCYAGIPGDKNQSWGERLERLVNEIENKESPDIVLLDSRAGVHDIAAVAVTRMGSFSFLFAVDSSQTWKAYSFLFDYWKHHPRLNEIRANLQIVASMIPETEREPYLKRFREHAWDLFRENLYDEAPKDATDVFNFDLNDEDAPHSPLPMFWHRALQEFEPAGRTSTVEEKTAEDALGVFMRRAEKLVFSEAEERLP
jgi:hypothetical protein